jgi:hypothetical protein
LTARLSGDRTRRGARGDGFCAGGSGYGPCARRCSEGLMQLPIDVEASAGVLIARGGRRRRPERDGRVRRMPGTGRDRRLPGRGRLLRGGVVRRACRRARARSSRQARLVCVRGAMQADGPRRPR